jgi:hypothetical protein
MSYPRMSTFTRLVAMSLTGWALLSGVAQAATNVGVSVSINQPGFYGRVDIGDQQPVVIYPQPIIIQQSPVAVHQRPIYLRVPPGHSKDWARYCSRYRACGQPVYFIRDAAPAPRYDNRRDDRDQRWDNGRDDRRDDHRGGGRDDRDDDRGPGRGHGRGHGHD